MFSRCPHEIRRVIYYDTACVCRNASAYLLRMTTFWLNYAFYAILTPKDMDFLDPAKERRHRFGLRLSYILVSVAIAIASVVLLYQTDGYCIDRDGDVNRCGLVFVSSQPDGASIYLDDVLQDSRTNAKLNLQAGAYGLRVEREGYRTWQRIIDSIGGGVRRYDYIFMFPSTLQTATVDTYTSELSVASQSLDKRWLATAQATQPGTFTIYDLRRPQAVTSSSMAIPATVYSAGDGAQTWSAVEWSRDNKHLLLKHVFVSDNKQSTEYIVLDRENAANSVNITQEMGLNATDVPSLFDQLYDEYYVYNSKEQTLRTTSLDGSDTALVLEHVITYKTTSDDTVLYVTDTAPDGEIVEGKVNVVLLQGNRSQVIRQFDAGAQTYVLDIAEYDGDSYVVLGSSSEDGVRIYKNPLAQVLLSADSLPAPTRFLRVADVSRVSFSSNARFIMAEHGQNFAVYDNEYADVYTYQTSKRLDSTSGYARWMDGHRLYYISNNELVVRDYDNQNIQTLQSADPKFPVFFSSDYSRVFAVSEDESSAAVLTATDLRVTNN